MSADGQPIVAWGDPVDGAVHAAVLEGDAWTDEIVQTGADGTGMAAATDGASTFLTYYSGAGEVRLAERSGGTWSTTSAAETNDPDEVTGVEAATTGVAVHEDTIYVTWQDEEGVQLAEGDGDTFTEVPSSRDRRRHHAGHRGLGRGHGHARVVLADDPGPAGRLPGRARRDHDREPEPRPDGVDHRVRRSSAVATRGRTSRSPGSPDNSFDKDCLVAPADEPFEITFNNEGGLHNFDCPGCSGRATASPRPSRRPGRPRSPSPSIRSMPAEYYFQCDVHPTTMFGTLAVVKGAK